MSKVREKESSTSNEKGTRTGSSGDSEKDPEACAAIRVAAGALAPWGRWLLSSALSTYPQWTESLMKEGDKGMGRLLMSLSIDLLNRVGSHPWSGIRCQGWSSSLVRLAFVQRPYKEVKLTVVAYHDAEACAGEIACVKTGISHITWLFSPGSK